MKYWLAAFIVLIPFVIKSEDTRTIYNPFTGRMDYITKSVVINGNSVSSMTFNGCTVSINGGTATITCSGGGGGQGAWYSQSQPLTAISTVGVFGDILASFSGSSVVIRVDLSTYTQAIIGLNAPPFLFTVVPRK